jgi:DNA-nicking Smr family endonuclease
MKYVNIIMERNKMKNEKMLDVHGLLLSQAIIVIKKAIEQAYNNGCTVLYVNHGFNNGRKIKTWCANEAINIDHVLKVTSGINDGITNIYIKLNLKNLI